MFLVGDKIFAQAPKEEVLHKMKKRVTRKESREQLEGFRLSCEVIKVMRHFFPQLWEELSRVKDPRHASYITYSSCTILMTRILSAIFYISSMRKASEELNTKTAIKNIGELCHQELEELPYWETINNYLKRIDPEEPQGIVCKMAYGLIRSRAFEEGRIRNRYWQILIDGTQIISGQRELDGKYIFKVHNKGKENEYTEYSYYVLEAKIVLRNNIVVSIMSEFVENKEEEYQKQDCERKAGIRLMERLKRVFPRLPICISGDSLYACKGFFHRCRSYGWHFLVRFKAGSIPTVEEEFDTLKKLQNNLIEQSGCCYDFVTGIHCQGIPLNYAHCAEHNGRIFNFLTDLPLTKKNVPLTVFYGRRRWRIENYGFNAQKNHGYFIQHLFSRNCQAMKNHYFLIQIAHMISQIMDAWKALWQNIKLSGEQKHKRMLESWKTDIIDGSIISSSPRFQIRFV